jgi:hypothetical protein
MKVDGNAGVTGADQEIGMAPEAMMMAVEDALTKGDIGSWKGVPLKEAPCVDNLRSMVLDKTYAFIMEDQTQIDYPTRTAFVDQDAKQFFLKVEGHTGDLGPKPTFWFGPVGFEVEGG